MKRMSCEEVVDSLSDYVEGRMSAGEHARMEEHLAVCSPCAKYLKRFEATLAACRSLRSAEFASQLPEMPEELMQAILAARKDEA
jgi:anti-sigma factor RsiW